MDFRKFDFNNIEFEALTANPNAPSYQSCKPKQPVMVQLPNLEMPFAVSLPNPEKKITKHSLPLALKGSKFEQDLIKFVDDFDEALINYAHKHSTAFFGKQQTLEVCRAFANMTKKVDDNAEKAAKYGPRLSPTVQISDDGVFYNTQVYDIDKKKIGPLDIQKHSSGYVTIELTSLYVVAGKAFGAIWVVRNVQITKHAMSEAPPIDFSMYDDCPPELEAAMLAIPIPGEEAIAAFEHEKVGEKAKRAEPEEETKPAKKSKKSKK